MNIRFLITAAVAAVSIMAFAQKPPAGGQGRPGGPPGGMRREMDPELKKQLALTPAQEKKIQAIRDKYMAKLKAAGAQPPKPGQTGQRPDMSKIRPIFDAMRKEIDAVYTPKQKAVLEKWRAAHPRRGGPGGPGGPGGHGGPGGNGGKGGGTGHGG